MLQLPKVLLFTAITFLSWGSYGVLLLYGKNAMGESSLRPFVAVGVAYFLIAVMGSAILMSSKRETGRWSISGIFLSLFAGSVGALGALGVLLALKYGGSPTYVMPLVFGGAPVVNTLVTSILGRTFNQISPKFIVGLLLVALGAVGVMVTKPSAGPSHSVSASAMSEAPSGGEASSEQTLDSAKSISTTSPQPKVETDMSKVALSIIIAIVCWGGYGPFLHIGQMRMGGSRLRPFFCVGIAYMIIAVTIPLILLSASGTPEPGSWDLIGFLWSLAAGAAGAIGALGIIFAFTFGGKPIYVMPLIFGFAPVINTLISMTSSHTFGQINVYFLLSMIVVIAGAVAVLVFAPKSAPHGAKTTGKIDAAAPKKSEQEPKVAETSAANEKRIPFEQSSQPRTESNE